MNWYCYIVDIVSAIGQATFEIRHYQTPSAPDLYCITISLDDSIVWI